MHYLVVIGVRPDPISEILNITPKTSQQHLGRQDTHIIYLTNIATKLVR